MKKKFSFEISNLHPTLCHSNVIYTYIVALFYTKHGLNNLNSPDKTSNGLVPLIRYIFFFLFTRKTITNDF